MPYLGHGWYAAGSDKGTYVSGDMVFWSITLFNSCFYVITDEEPLFAMQRKRHMEMFV